MAVRAVRNSWSFSTVQQVPCYPSQGPASAGRGGLEEGEFESQEETTWSQSWVQEDSSVLCSRWLPRQLCCLSFMYQFSRLPRFPFDHPMDQHFMTWFLEDSKYTFLNMANEFRDLSAFASTDNKLAGWDLALPSPLRLSRALISFWQAGSFRSKPLM